MGSMALQMRGHTFPAGARATMSCRAGEKVARGMIPMRNERNSQSAARASASPSYYDYRRAARTSLRGDGDIVSGWKNKLQSAIANVTPASILAKQHAKMAKPGSAGE